MNADGIMEPFEGTIWADPRRALRGRRGHFRWLGRDTPDPRVSGTLDVAASIGGPAPFNPFGIFGVAELKGRIVTIEIPGVGRFPARLYCTSRNPVGYPSARLPDTIDFHSWCRPVPIATHRELVSALDTAIWDALEQAGHPELADLARAAAVAIGGWPQAPSWTRTRGRAEREAKVEGDVAEFARPYR